MFASQQKSSSSEIGCHGCPCALETRGGQPGPGLGARLIIGSQVILDTAEKQTRSLGRSHSRDTALILPCKAQLSCVHGQQDLEVTRVHRSAEASP